MTALLVARAIHYAAATQVFGGLLFALAIAPASAVGRFPAAFQRTFCSVLLGSAVLALLSWLAWVLFVVHDITGSPGMSIDPDALRRLLFSTAFGRLWLLRLGLWVALLAMLASTRRGGMDARPLLWTATIVAAMAIASLAGSGHAAAQTGAARPIALVSDGAHLLAAGAWLGALLPFALALAVITAPAPLHALARRFSMVGIAAVGVLVASGILNSVYLVGSWPRLLGTPYGHWLLLKLALLTVMLMLAGANRRATPSLALASNRAAPARRRIARNSWIEATLGAAVLAVVAVLGVSTPGTHEQPRWPLSFRLDFSAGMPIVVDAYPTTFVEPPVPYTAAALAHGLQLYEHHCVACHGHDGHGNGAAAATLSPAPADLAAGHVLAHAPGDLFWWISHGIAGTAMPAFTGTLNEQERWELVHLLRAIADAHLLDVSPTAAAVAAPAFTYQLDAEPQATVPDTARAAATLIVLYTLPNSSRRLAELREATSRLHAAGLRVVALTLDAQVPSATAPDAPASVAPEVSTAYRLLVDNPQHDTTHVEFVVDRDGWLRARWIAPESESVDGLIRLVKTLPPAHPGMAAPTHARHS